MTIYAIFSGSLRGGPSSKTSANGKEYATAFVTTKDGNERVGIRLMAFGPMAEKLMSVKDEGAISAQGMLRAEMFNGKDGVARVSLTVFVNTLDILANPAFRKPERKAAEKAEEALPAPVEKKTGLDRHAGEGIDYFNDSVPF